MIIELRTNFTAPAIRLRRRKCGNRRDSELAPLFSGS
jgi:hypothetical protein